MTSEHRALRCALGAFPTGVTVVTTKVLDTVVPIVASSFTSVSLEPPLVLWCIDARSSRYAAFRDAETYVISVLGKNHAALCSHIVGRGPFEALAESWEPTEVGPPAIRGAAAVFECRAHAAMDHGDHAVLIGRVERFQSDPSAYPLLFHKGQLGCLQEFSQAPGVAA